MAKIPDILAFMLRTLKAKLYPNSSQARQLNEYLEQGRYVFNRCLEQRRDKWREEKKGISRFDQTKHLTEWRSADGRLAAVPCQVERDAIRRVDLAFQGFFRRVKAKVKKCGYPRFKGRNRWNSFGVGQCGDVLKVQGRVHVSGIDKPIRARGLQAIIGKIKNLRVVRRAGKWFARILIDDGIATPAKQPVVKSIGLDMGLDSFVATSEGLCIKAPQFYRKLEVRLRWAGRSVSRCKRGSNGRARAVLKLQQAHEKIQNHREDFLHKLSKLFVSKYSLIAAEKLNIGGMVRSKLAKSILDAGWGKFLWMLDYKAEKAGKTFVQVNARNTSQECSRCGCVVQKDLSVRVHKCDCGLTLDRDINAARNILARGLLISTSPSGRDCVMRTEGRKTPGKTGAASLTFTGSK